MKIKNTAQDYGFIAKCLHWGTAILFLASYVSVYYRQWFTESRTPENMTALHLHLSVGISIAVLVVLRIIWKMNNTQPEHEPGTKLEHLAAQVGHYLLYIMIVLMVLTGYMGTGLPTHFFFLFEIPKFEDTWAFSALSSAFDVSFEELEKPIDFIHKDIMGAWLTWLLILGHAGAALYHHYVKKDRTIYKMTTGKQ